MTMLDGWHLVVLGFGRSSHIRQVHTWAEEAGVQDRVHVLPARPFSELVQTAAAATVGIVPIRADSLNNYTGDTNKLHEYLMAGLPVVASDIPEVRRVLEQGNPRIGETFDPTSPASIAQAVRQVADDATYAARRAESDARTESHWPGSQLSRPSIIGAGTLARDVVPAGASR